MAPFMVPLRVHCSSAEVIERSARCGWVEVVAVEWLRPETRAG
jgi:hypothetical protein